MKFRFQCLTMGVMSLLLTACSIGDAGEEWQEESQVEVRSARMNFQVNVSAFDANQSSTRATEEWIWEDGAVVYVQFYNGSNLVRGHAKYSQSTNSWEAFWNGTISGDDKCEVYFFEGASTSDKHKVSLNELQAVYADKSAAYTLDGNDLTILANLSPLTSRVRFAGNVGLGIEVSNLTYYVGYDADVNQFITSSESFRGQVGNNGFTSYYYCFFSDADQRRLGISNSVEGNEFIYTKSFGASVLKIGESGYITIPSEETNKGWSIQTPPLELDFTVSGNGRTVSFKIKRVNAGSFQMGKNNENPSSNSHTVKLTWGFYMGETEVTQGLWYAVMGTDTGDWNSSFYGTGNDYPAYSVNYEDCELFLSKLNQKTGKKFRFPTEAEWEYAAKGGNESKGYIYSGSNSLYDVAWYGDYTSHEVKGKSPNELGLYDMNGNVAEWCYDWYDSYSSSLQVDPIGPESGTYRVARGGHYSSKYEDCRPEIRTYYSPTSRNRTRGLRIAL